MGKRTDTKEIIRQLRRFKSRIKRRFEVDAIILFGSAARGKMTGHSDIDIIVVSRKYGIRDIFKITPLLYNEWHMKEKIDFPVDILLYNTQEFRRLSKEVSIVREALMEGIEI